MSIRVGFCCIAAILREKGDDPVSEGVADARHLTHIKPGPARDAAPDVPTAR
jgi:hypothetical protein